MTVLRLTPIGAGAVGPALATVDGVVLARHAGIPYAEVPVALVPSLTRALALAGIDAQPCDADLAPPAGLHAARGVDLSPIGAGIVDLDIVRLRRIPLGSATREVLRRPFAGLLPANPIARDRCRALLRGDDVLFAWARTAWASRAALRSPAARGPLRPIVFDRDAAARVDLTGRISSRDDGIGSWLFA